MGNASSSVVLKHLTTLFQGGTATGRDDGSLLDRFRGGAADEAEAAFAVLVERHGPMVFQVCRRILGNRHDAEDAAQAVFLVLARQARSIRRTDSVASWLYGVAARVATRARLDAARRRLRERRGTETATAIRDVELREGDGAETWPELYHELDRLPERFRLPILLCHLEGLTYEQAAQQIGCPIRTVQSRLARARERLRERLTRRGLGPAAAPLLAALSNPDAASAVVSESWKHVTVQAAARYAASGASAAVVSASVAALVEGASRAMGLQNLMRWAAALLLIGVSASGAGLGMLARSAPPEPEPEHRITPTEDESRYRAAFKDGVMIEVVGISTVPTGPNTWWKPDGTPLAEAPVDRINDQNDQEAERTYKVGAYYKRIGRVASAEFHFGKILQRWPNSPWTVKAKVELAQLAKTSREAALDHEDHEARVILLRVSGLKKDDMFRWHPVSSSSYSDARPRKDGQDVPGLEYYVAVFPGDRPTCEVQARLAAGPWKTEVSNDGKGGVGTFVNGHKFSFGKARPYEASGRSMTVFSVAHNFFEQDRRLVAVDRGGNEHAAVSYSSGSDGDKRWVIDLIDAEFPLPPDQIREFQVQFRPFEIVEIKHVALNPRPSSVGSAR